MRAQAYDLRVNKCKRHSLKKARKLGQVVSKDGGLCGKSRSSWCRFTHEGIGTVWQTALTCPLSCGGPWRRSCTVNSVQRNCNHRHLRSCSSYSIAAVLLIACVSAICVLASSGSASARQVSNKVRQKSQLSLSTEETSEAEQRLSDLGYWTGFVDGALDEGSRQALIAFQKVEARQRTGKLTLEELQALRTAKRLSAREIGYAHIEIDLGRQVLFAVDVSGSVSKILPVSTGTGKLFTAEGRTRRAVTPSGRFTISHKIAGWRKSPLGLLYYPNYIVGGIAIHGNPSVPVYPASHGCIRIPMFAAKQFSEIYPVGTVVIVYYGESVE